MCLRNNKKYCLELVFYFEKVEICASNDVNQKYR